MIIQTTTNRIECDEIRCIMDSLHLYTENKFGNLEEISQISVKDVIKIHPTYKEIVQSHILQVREADGRIRRLIDENERLIQIINDLKKPKPSRWKFWVKI
jgi:hypothetical protein